MELIEDYAPVVETETEPATVASTPPTTAPALNVGKITTKGRTGIRKVRGKPTEVALPIIDVLIDGVLVALTGETSGRPIMAIREVLEHEIPPIVAAITKQRGDSEPPQFIKRPRAK